MPRATPEYSKRAKYNYNIVDGLLYNGDNYDNWFNIISPQNISSNVDRITIDIASGTSFAQALPCNGVLLPSTEYTLVYEFENSNFTTTSVILWSTGIVSSTAQLDESDGIHRVLFTTDATITNDYLAIASFNAVVGDSGDFKNFGVYKGDLVTGTPPLPDGFVEGNSFKIDQFYSEVFIADETFILYDATGVQKVIEIATVANITNDQLFINKDTKQIGFFEAPLVRHSDCEHKTRRFFDLNEQFFVTIEGAPGTYEPYMVETFEGSGIYEAMWVLKEGVTYV